MIWALVAMVWASIGAALTSFHATDDDGPITAVAMIWIWPWFAVLLLEALVRDSLHGD